MWRGSNSNETLMRSISVSCVSIICGVTYVSTYLNSNGSNVQCSAYQQRKQLGESNVASAAALNGSMYSNGNNKLSNS